MGKASRFRNFTLLGVLLAATVFSCKSKEGSTDGTAADTTVVDTTTPPPPAQDIPADTTTTPADTTAMPAK